MEGNKDEALKCCHLAEKLLRTGHKEKAAKFLAKSIKLFPTPKAQELLNEIAQDSASCNGSAPPDGATNTRRRRKSSSANKEPEPSSESSTEKDYTPEQVAEVKKILGCKDYYEVLSIGKDFSESEIKKAYRKLALQFHPDKNKAPKAADAFKRIGHAFAVLNDEEKRRKYDQYGEDLAPAHTERHRYRQRDFEGDISPEDLFNMFFGGGFPNGNVYVHRTRNNHHQQQHNEQQTTSMYPLIQILPILMIILFSFLTSFLVPEPIYSFQQTSQYRYQFQTRRWQVQYFVKDMSIKEKYPPDEFADIERKIEREFVETLQLRCYRERQYKAELLQQARLWGNLEMKRRAERYTAESCQQLENFSSR